MATAAQASRRVLALRTARQGRAASDAAPASALRPTEVPQRVRGAVASAAAIGFELRGGSGGGSSCDSAFRKLPADR